MDRRSFIAGSAASLALPSALALAAKPRRTSVGIYNTVFNPAKRTIDDNLERARRLTDAGLHQFHIMRVSDRDVSAAADAFSRLRENGVEGGLRPNIPFKNVDKWFDGTNEQMLGAYKPLDGLCRDIYLGHEVFEWANRRTRQQITLSSKRVLPKTKVRLYYGHLELPERHGNAAHKRGGTWTDYAIIDAAHEPDIIHFTTSHLEGPPESLTRAFDFANGLVRRVAPGKSIYCHMNFFEETLATADGQSKLRKFADYVTAKGTDVFLLRSIGQDKQKKNISNESIALIGRILRA